MKITEDILKDMGFNPIGTDNLFVMSIHHHYPLNSYNFSIKPSGGITWAFKMQVENTMGDAYNLFNFPSYITTVEQLFDKMAERFTDYGKILKVEEVKNALRV